MNHTEQLLDKRLHRLIQSREALIFHLEREIPIDAPVNIQRRIHPSFGKFTCTVNVRVTDTVCCIKDGKRWKVGIAPQSISDGYAKKEGNRVAFINAENSDSLTATEVVALVSKAPEKNFYLPIDKPRNQGTYVGRREHSAKESFEHMKGLMILRNK